MTVQPIEHENQVAEFNASRDTMESLFNTERLARWKARYPYRTVEVPTPVNPPVWPALRCSVPAARKVVQLRRKS